MAQAASQPPDIHKSAGILLRDRKFLVVRAKDNTVFYSPGGKIESGETPEDALIRELQEELQITVERSDLEIFGNFTAFAATDNSRTIRMDVFLVKKWMGELTAAQEIEELAWIDSTPPSDMEIGSIFEHEVLPRLKENELIN